MQPSWAPRVSAGFSSNKTRRHFFRFEAGGYVSDSLVQAVEASRGELQRELGSFGP